MAKKGKKAKSLFANYGSVLLLCLGVIIAITAFLAVVSTTKGDTTSTLTGVRAAFGGAVDGLSLDLGILGSQETSISSNTLIVLVYLLPVIGGIVAVLMTKKNKIGGLVALVCFLFSAIVAFLIPGMIEVVSKTVVLGKESINNIKIVDLEYQMTYGTIITGVVSVIGVITSGLYICTK